MKKSPIKEPKTMSSAPQKDKRQNVEIKKSAVCSAHPYIFLFVFAKIGILSFGGPAAQISLMHHYLVDKMKWLTEKQFLNGLSFCMLLPGPEAMQLATYVGWRLYGIWGGLIAGLLFVLPGAAIILVLASFYVFYGTAPLVTLLFSGVKAAVIMIVLAALIKLSKKALLYKWQWLVVLFAFISIFFLNLPFPIIITLAALYGAFLVKKTLSKHSVIQSKTSRNSLTKTLQTTMIWLLIWLTPLIILEFSNQHDLLRQIGFFFSKLAIVTFGGAYAVLAYMSQQIVQNFSWLTANEMIDALGLAETTPGPLILVTEFVGFLAAYREGGFWYGFLGAIITLWVTFVPCFLWIFAGAPYIEWISVQPRLANALSAISACVVGVMLNLALWFALHVYFEEITQKQYAFINLWQPDLATFNWKTTALSFIAGYFLLIRKSSISIVLLISAIGSYCLSFL